MELREESYDDQAVRPVNIGSMIVGGGTPVVIGGPCSVEHDYPDHAEAVAATGVNALRAGVYKHRTDPSSFQGLGQDAIPLLAEARRRTGLPMISEVLDGEDAEILADHVDAYQVGARNMQNVRLLEALGDIGKPVVLKRGLSATIDEWIAASEYVRRRGNHDVVLCERGIRTFEPRTRNTLDLSAVVVAHELTDLPVIVDPSHAAGQRRWVPRLAQAALTVGAEGLLIEVHVDPVKAWSDSDQAIDLDACRDLVAAAGTVSRGTWSGGSIAECRQIVDGLDGEIRRLIGRRLEVSRAIQASRVSDGGHKVDRNRESDVIAGYRSELGPEGELLAYHVLGLCRGQV
jgi:3-deoxy-7-phosphoheptulonate synthase